MARRFSDPDFVEALARGLDVIEAFRQANRSMTLTEIATCVELPRPTARRLLKTLELQGYVRSDAGAFQLTPRVMALGMAYVRSNGLWAVARPHMQQLCSSTHESTSIAQLDGSDIVYTARVSVPKLIGLSVEIGTRFPAMQTSLGRVLLASLSEQDVDAALSVPSRSGVVVRRSFSDNERRDLLSQVRARGWALADEALALGVRSIAAPLHDGSGAVVAALNVSVHAAETSIETLVGDQLPLLLRTAAQISADWAARDNAPHVVTERP